MNHLSEATRNLVERLRKASDQYDGVKFVLDTEFEEGDEVDARVHLIPIDDAKCDVSFWIFEGLPASVGMLQMRRVIAATGATGDIISDLDPEQMAECAVRLESIEHTMEFAAAIAAGGVSGEIVMWGNRYVASYFKLEADGKQWFSGGKPGTLIKMMISAGILKVKPVRFQPWTRRAS